MIPQGSIKDLSFGGDVPSDRREGISQGEGGAGACPPEKYLKWICAEMQFGAFWDTQFWEMLRYRVCTDLVGQKYRDKTTLASSS